MSRPTVFIIHGRDTDAVLQLTKFLVRQGLDVRTVTQLATRQGGPASIQDLVAHGIKNADIIICLLTPDEAVTLYEPASGRLTTDSGWQPRPNVIFELGLAFGIAEEKLILTSLGNVRPFTDLGGVLFLDLAGQGSKSHLLEGIAHALVRGGKEFTAAPVNGDFSQLRILKR